jgi:hypothetical protein
MDIKKIAKNVIIESWENPKDALELFKLIACALIGWMCGCCFYGCIELKDKLKKKLDNQKKG